MHASYAVRRRPRQPHTYMCLVAFVYIIPCYVYDTLVYRQHARIHRYIVGNGTSAYSIHSTVCSVLYILYVVLIKI